MSVCWGTDEPNLSLEVVATPPSDEPDEQPEDDYADTYYDDPARTSGRP